MIIMKIITINLPEKYLEAIEILKTHGIVPSRSEAVRTALRDFLDKELLFFNNLSENTFGMIVRSGLSLK